MILAILTMRRIRIMRIISDKNYRKWHIIWWMIYKKQCYSRTIITIDRGKNIRNHDLVFKVQIITLTTVKIPTVISWYHCPTTFVASSLAIPTEIFTMCMESTAAPVGIARFLLLEANSFCRGLGAPNLRHFLHLASKIQAGSAFASTNLSHNSILRPNGWA